MTGIAVAGLVVGAAGAYMNNKNAQDAKGQQQKQYEEDLASRQAFQADQNKKYGPLEQQMIEAASGNWGGFFIFKKD